MYKISQINYLWEPRMYGSRLKNKKMMSANQANRTRTARSQSNRRHH